MSLPVWPVLYSCSRPFWDRLSQAVNDPSALFDWLFCPYSIEIGLVAVGTIVLMTGFIGFRNWSEGWTLPLTWLALVAPLVAMTALPGGLIRLIAGALTFGVLALWVGIYYWWGRA